MAKVALRYKGDDEAMQKRLEGSEGIVLVEPIDAREILASSEDYEIDDESRKMIGMQFDPRLFGANGKPGDKVAKPEDEGKANVPQLQGDDAELQTGLSAEKYGRSQVVKGVPEGSQPTAMRPMTTMGQSLNLEERREQSAAAAAANPPPPPPPPRMGLQQQSPSAQDNKPPSEGMTSEEMREALKAKNVQFPPDAKKAELAELVDRHNARKV
jgi:hypothetical protein